MNKNSHRCRIKVKLALIFQIRQSHQFTHLWEVNLLACKGMILTLASQVLKRWLILKNQLRNLLLRKTFSPQVVINTTTSPNLILILSINHHLLKIKTMQQVTSQLLSQVTQFLVWENSNILKDSPYMNRRLVTINSSQWLMSILLVEIWELLKLLHSKMLVMNRMSISSHFQVKSKLNNRTF